eukprot:scaffold103235_cov63-Phaeocystis_antarctica.AAC.9
MLTRACGDRQRYGCLKMVRDHAERAFENAGGPLSLPSWHGTGSGSRFQYVGTLRGFMSKSGVYPNYQNQNSSKAVGPR